MNPAETPTKKIFRPVIQNMLVPLIGSRFTNFVF
jgi:hypothetical protein